ncbi:cold shock domain-containing protein E1 [Octopus bimaculoides]|uniref:Cold shock domain-containing protein E1 n=1 Tax=Octopus bimaculoides TaxID=37653 RepID=A0A0L8G6C8_OCTBM|nr:cold shock domain-containing protein E1 [Octopus bimaculoides]|eukprot:XP_014783652.1 PREDICTED: cold shock domain-containing protein E1-like [Octopus bimaculoides]
MSNSRKTTSPQWKNFQPPAQNPSILYSQRTPTTNNSIATSPNGTSNGVRQTGFVEKLLHSYGFIQCNERESRVFFHFSEYSGNAENVKVGDPVEFQLSYDRRTGKRIACSVIKIDPGVSSQEILSEERFQGSIVQEAKPVKAKNGTVSGNQDGLGRVTYLHNGECFFLPYGLEDVIDGSSKLKAGDQVRFYIASDKRNGNIRARRLESVMVQNQEKYQGVVCSMKENFGFIERSDVVKEIFFHYSEYKGDISELLLGDDVEFQIQSRSRQWDYSLNSHKNSNQPENDGREVAVNISRLPEGTVIFEDVAIESINGRILKTLKNSNKGRQGDPLCGRIVYEVDNRQVEIPFGDKDQKGDFTLQVDDLVAFNIATDRRDGLQRATQIELLDCTFEKSKETREVGIVATLKEGYGFIQCADRDLRVFFHFSEMLDQTKELKLQDEVEFTVVQDPSSPNKQIAIRIKMLPKRTLSLTISTEKYIGTIDREPATHKSPGKNKEGESGNIIYDYEGAIQQIPYYLKDLVDQKGPPRYGDKIEFSIGESSRNGQKRAVNIRVVLRNVAGKCQGFIATLKDNYGFIENADHEKEVFFHFSSIENDQLEFNLGDEVEYTLAKKGAKLSAENIKKLPKGTVSPEEIIWEKGTLQGKIIRPLRIVNPEQDEYSGLVQVGLDEDEEEVYQYGITSLADKRDFLQKGDVVKFQIASVKATGKKRAVCVAAMRSYVRAKVDSVKGLFGFLNYEVEDGKKLFFHMTEVHDSIELQPGDEVEFVVVQNQRNAKFSACSLRKITDTRRPDRLLNRLKSFTEETGPRIILIRAPKGPDGTKGFAHARTAVKILE